MDGLIGESQFGTPFPSHFQVIRACSQTTNVARVVLIADQVGFKVAWNSFTERLPRVQGNKTPQEQIFNSRQAGSPLLRMRSIIKHLRNDHESDAFVYLSSHQSIRPSSIHSSNVSCPRLRTSQSQAKLACIS